MGVYEQKKENQGIRLFDSLELELEVFYLICSSLGKKTVAQIRMPSPWTAL